MSDVKLGTYHISNSLQSYESARSNFFTLLVEDFEDLLYPQFSYTGENVEQEYITKSGNGGHAKLTGQDVIKLSVNKMFVPHFNLGQIEIRRGNSIVRFADTPSWDAGTIELQDFVGIETKNVLMAWQALAYDVNTDTQGRAGDWTDDDGILHRGYKRDCTLIEYTPDFQQIRYWKLKGCWISQISESNFEVDASGGRALTATLQYDRAFMYQPDTTFSVES